MKSAANDVEQALSLPFRRPELGLSDELGRLEVERASSGPTLARAESSRLLSLKRPSNPTSTQPSRAPNLPCPALPGGNDTAKVCQKTDYSDRFVPTLNPPGSKKIIET